MNALMLGLDKALLKGDSIENNDSKKRHVLYGKFLTNLFIIIPASKKYGLNQRQLSDNVFVYPASGSGNLFSFVNMYKIGKNICRGEKIDFITAQDYFLTGLIGYLLKKKFGIPLNIQMHGDFLDNQYWLKKRWYNFLLNFIGKKLICAADTIRIGAYGNLREKLVKDYRLNSHEIYSIPIFIDLNGFFNCSGASLRQEFINQGFEKIVLFTGRLTYQKDLFTLFNAAKIVLEKMPKVLFLIAGDGEQKNKLKLLSQKLGISGNIIFKGEIPRDQMPEYFSACDVFVLTSLYEGYPRVLIEASASRKPIVTTDFTSAEDIVRDGKTGFIVRIRDAKAVADRINRLLYNPGLSVEMGNNGFRHIQEIFDEKKILNDLIMMWRATAKAKK